LQTATGAIAVDGIAPLTFLLFMREASRSEYFSFCVGAKMH
jgi:hypothetical protein